MLSPYWRRWRSCERQSLRGPNVVAKTTLLHCPKSHSHPLHTRNRALIGTLSFFQLRRWQDRDAAPPPTAAGGAAAGTAVDATAHAIVDAAEEEAQHG